MVKFLSFILLGLLSSGVSAQNLSLDGFHKRFHLERNSHGEVVSVRLKKASVKISLLPFIDQLQRDLLTEQGRLEEDEALKLLNELGDTVEVRHLKTAVRSIKKVSLNAVFAKLRQKKFWARAEKVLKSSLLYTNPSYLLNLERPRFFYKKRVGYYTLMVLSDLARGTFIEIPVLNMANMILRRVHWMMMEQRHFHHNMLLHYFETFSPEELGFTQEEAKRALSSIYEYRILSIELNISNRAKRNWAAFGVQNFYNQIYNDERYMSVWQEDMKLPHVRKLNFAFAQAGNKIYHLHVRNHLFSSRPSLAYDFERPEKVRQLRSVLNIAGLGLGFIAVPGLIVKDLMYVFLESLYIGQVRMEGALVGYYESRGEMEMVHKIYEQRANNYIIE